MLTVFGPDRLVVLARELTKLFETIYQAPLKELLPWLNADQNRLKGEFVIIVSSAKAKAKPSTHVEVTPEAILDILLKELSTKQAVNLTAQITGAPKNFNLSNGIE